MSASPRPRLLEGLVQEYWAPLVLFDAAWRVVVWNRQAESQFGRPADAALGRSLEESGILPDPGYGDVVRRRVEHAGDTLLAAERPGPPGNGAATVLHRFRRIGRPDERLGFLCVSEVRESPGSARSLRPPRPVGHMVQDVEVQVQELADRLQSESSLDGGRAQEIRRVVSNLRGLAGELGRLAGGARESSGRSVLQAGQAAASPAAMRSSTHDPEEA